MDLLICAHSFFSARPLLSFPTANLTRAHTMSHWLPLESNPEVMNKFIHGLGVTGNFSYTDVWGLDDELLETVPKPVAAVILLFPVSDSYIEYREASEAEQASKPPVDPAVFFMKQTIENACGTIGIIHSIANNLDKVVLAPGGFLAQFLEKARRVSPDERAALLEQSEEIAQAHEESAHEGQTEAPEPEELVNLHFIAFTNHQGQLLQLDGCRQGPISHGPTNQETFLRDVAQIAKEFMARDPEEMRFTVIALASNQDQ
eukprot:m.177138 g.177138  ORF g.177138 m.177138 type:complete len:260 (+) comp53366_c0_seq3:1287-2066(+)